MSILLRELGVEKLDELISNIYWYHTIDFGNKLVSKGVYNMDEVINYYGFKKNLLKNKSVLDVGASDGYFSFYFEKMGAKSVLAVDVNKHDGELQVPVSPNLLQLYKKGYSAFTLTKREHKNKNDVYRNVNKLLKTKTLNNLLLAKDLMNSKVQFQYLSVYKLETLNKKFDLVFAGDLIEHLKNPIEAVEQLRKITKNTCVISLSSCLNLGNDSNIDSFKSKLATYLIEFRGFNLPFLYKNSILNSKVVTYHGYKSGRSFFHFSTGAFKELLLASGFKKVVTAPTFLQYNYRRSLYNPRTIFYCEV